MRSQSIQARRIVVSSFCGLGLVSASLEPAMAQRTLPVRVNRWLELRQMNGSVSYVQGGGARNARLGDRLQSVGDGLRTGGRSNATLALDSGVGQVLVSEQTYLQVRSLDMAPSGGRITRLAVTSGQVRLQVRPFNNPDSRLEIETPAGVTGVRGTEFGVGVQPSGKMSLATLNGRVAVAAQGRAVAVNAGFQNLTIPGEPPSPPVPITNDTQLYYRLVKVLNGNVRSVRLDGKIDPVNTLLINNVAYDSDRNGQFSVVLPAVSFPQVNVAVITPLGLRQDYALALR